MQNTAFEMVILQIGFYAQRLQRSTAVNAHGHQLADVFSRPARCAFAQELQSPAPLLQISLEAKQQRRIFFAQPFQNLKRRAGIGPRHGMAGGNLSAIGKARFQARAELTINDRDIMARFT